MKKMNVRILKSMIALCLSLNLMLFLLARADAESLPYGKVVDRVVQPFPLTGVTLEVLKVVDLATGKGYLIATDAQGKRRDLDQVVVEEQRARIALYGKLDPSLHEKLAQMKEQDKIPISIWLNVPDPPLSRPQADQEMTAEAALISHLDGVKNYMAPKRQGVVEALARMGAGAQEPLYAPAVFAELTPGQIKEISKHPDVSTLYGPERYQLFLDDSCTTHRAHRVWAAGNLGQGGYSRPVVHEPDGIFDSNPYLNNIDHPVIYWNSANKFATGDHPWHWHATQVAGCIASTHPLFRGMAPRAHIILSANSQTFDDVNCVNAAEWAIYNGGCPVNMSWGKDCGGDQTFMSRYVDFATKVLRATFVISAGNTTGKCGTTTNDLKVAAPGLAWSVITVGSIEDDNDGFWTGDSMSTFSRYINPNFATGMEKPEVVAVGQAVMTTDGVFPSWITPSPGVNGTSFSAPTVAGQVVQMLGRRDLQKVRPETNKAAVLASAFHDIVAGSDRDGVGAVMMNISDDTYRLERFRNDYASGTTVFPIYYYDVLDLKAGQKVRVAFCWDSWSTGGAGTDVLGADLDLAIVHPDNTTIVAASASISNAWELCEFIAPVAGKYDIKLIKFSADTGWPGTFLGTAWSIYNKPNFTSGYVNVPSTGGTFSVNTANGGTYFDFYPGVGWYESGRERVYRLQLTTTKDITVNDYNPDLDLFVLQFPNANADPIVPTVRGHGSNSVFIDNAPAGIYWIVVDGYNGYVGSTPMTVSVTGP